MLIYSTLYLLAFFAGILTVLAPCVLPLLPIILGASTGSIENKKIPYIIIFSLSVSIFVFTFLLKVSTLLIDIHPSFWSYVSWGIVFTLGIFTLFPRIWKKISQKLHFTSSSQKLLEKSSQKKEGIIKYILLWVSLGPVFSSCSPTYGIIIAIVLPAWFVLWMGALISYILGLACILLAIALLGRKFTSKLRCISQPGWVFQIILWCIFVLLWLAIMLWYDKKLWDYILDSWYIGTTQFEQNILDNIELPK